ncbi:MAG: hypothetical protein HC927_12745 [Deltaproteobacteria bacterium]|nr:hypothetical protein [Deltaproteobacteria bacterium]
MISAAALLCTQSCAISPHNGELVDWTSLDFSGYALQSSATIEVQAYDYSTETWRVVTTATANAEPTPYAAEELYRWALMDFDFTTVPDAVCYWDHTYDGGPCTFPAGQAEARLRFKEVDSPAPYLTTFEEDGIECVLEAVGSGEDWFTAGNMCRSPDSPVVTVRMLS